MNNKKKKIAGFSLIEVMIATLLFSIIMLGFVNYQQALFYKHHYFTNYLRANKIAFQLLDSYPYTTNQIIPSGWHYKLTSKTYNAQCKMVVITVNAPNKQVTKQQRLFCNSL
ncbi:prepilin-type N-terminal cleavage/methylation domain-containing protein [Gilliamella sp. BG6]|uniref:prepilin-type N-terminal cleavage/methylation domain-containing protein n=1 Tax=unclassified Gilliamella TaxID=2685620 RepID=UPI0039873E90